MPQTKQLLLVPNIYPNLCGFCKRIAPQLWDGSFRFAESLHLWRSHSHFALLRGSIIGFRLSLYRVYRRIESLTKTNFGHINLCCFDCKKSDKKKNRCAIFFTFTEIHVGDFTFTVFPRRDVWDSQDFKCLPWQKEKFSRRETPSQCRSVEGPDIWSTFKFLATRPYQNHTWIPLRAQKVTLLHKFMYLKVVFCINLYILQWYRVSINKSIIKLMYCASGI